VCEFEGERKDVVAVAETPSRTHFSLRNDYSVVVAVVATPNRTSSSVSIYFSTEIER